MFRLRGSLYISICIYLCRLWKMVSVKNTISHTNEEKDEVNMFTVHGLRVPHTAEMDATWHIRFQPNCYIFTSMKFEVKLERVQVWCLAGGWWVVKSIYRIFEQPHFHASSLWVSAREGISFTMYARKSEYFLVKTKIPINIIIVALVEQLFGSNTTDTMYYINLAYTELYWERNKANIMAPRWLGLWFAFVCLDNACGVDFHELSKRPSSGRKCSCATICFDK